MASREENKSEEKWFRGSEGRDKPEGDMTSITLSEFFDFLSCAYQLNVDLAEKDRANSKIDWDKLTSNALLSKLIALHQNELNRTNKMKMDQRNRKIGFASEPETINSHNLIVAGIQDYLNSKVENVLDEGLLDSIMPFMVPKINSFESGRRSSDVSRRMSACDNYSSQQNNYNESPSEPNDIKEVEIDIQVCDELRHKTKMFKCPRDMLLAKMQYFADVTSGQKLEDMDISVHCDLTIFEWLMKWVKHTTPDNKPALFIQNVVQVLVSATFLQMEPLISECIAFLRQNVDEVIRTASSNLSCLNDTVITKIADALTNVEVDAMNDPKDKIQSRLFCKLIIFLASKTNDYKKGHFSSIAYLYKCSLCHKILHNDYGHYLPCLPKNIKLNTSGTMVGMHEVDETWSLNAYIKELKTELKTWRKVYWKLYGRCHYLKCSHCSCYYSICYTNWCRYHEQFPQFFPSEQGKSTSFVGKYMCCGAKTYRFEILPTPSGCTFRPHRPQLDSQLRQLLFIFDGHSKLICINPPKTKITYSTSKTCESITDGYDVNSDTIRNEYFWWHELNLTHNTLQMTLHKHIAADVLEDEHEDNDDIQDAENNSNSSKSANNILSEFSSEIYSSSDEIDSSSVDEDDVSDEDSPTQSHTSHSRRRKRYRNKIHAVRRAQFTKRWLPKLSVRCNQDNQRDKEERIMKSYVQKLTNRPSNTNCSELNRFQTNGFYSRCPSQDDLKLAGGTYAQLELEWRESLKQPSSPKKRSSSLKVKISGKQTGS
ncbi:uncharacterized protein KIAA1841 homolog isoform X1 [Cimex lectularius]|uniref:SANT and BTB domain-containing protein n=1 Tax=Cimex lectularius TaxID=79782 RepID=A0A8I6RCM5_CIMLE|nr:uncharacterized protein KIAA1841 homolog isoform X1 [Cimex lectularius]